MFDRKRPKAGQTKERATWHVQCKIDGLPRFLEAEAIGKWRVGVGVRRKVSASGGFWEWDEQTYSIPIDAFAVVRVDFDLVAIWELLVRHACLTHHRARDAPTYPYSIYPSST